MKRQYSALKSRARRIRRGVRRPAVDSVLAGAAAARALAEAVVVTEGPPPDPVTEPHVAVIMCVWDRLDRVPRLLRSVQQSLGVRPEMYLWNNRADAAERLLGDLRACGDTIPRTTLATSELNIGGFGRFYWARELAAQHRFVVFIDDDQILDPFALGELFREARPHALRSVWGFRFDNRYEYWRRKQVGHGEPAKYLGTGGMVADSSIFTEDELFGCPGAYWFMEDLWLSYYAQAIRGWSLHRSHAEIGMIFDGKDQYQGLRQAKNDFFRVLNNDARWLDVPRGRDQIPMPRRQEAPSLDPA